MELDSVYSLFPKACGLSQAEYWSLLLVYEGVETQSEISDLLFLSRQTLNSAFKQLKKKGLVRLEPLRGKSARKAGFYDGTRKRVRLLLRRPDALCGRAGVEPDDGRGTETVDGFDKKVQSAASPGISDQNPDKC